MWVDLCEEVSCDEKYVGLVFNCELGDLLEGIQKVEAARI